MSSTFTDKNNPFVDSLTSIPSLDLSHNRVPMEPSRLAFPTTVLREDETVKISLKRNDWVFHTGP